MLRALNRLGSVVLRVNGGAILCSVRFGSVRSIHVYRVLGIKPILLVTNVNGDQRELWSFAVVSTTLTARSRVLGELSGSLFHRLILTKNLTSDKSGAIKNRLGGIIVFLGANLWLMYILLSERLWTI